MEENKSPRDLWDNTEHASILIIGVWEKRERGRKIFEKILAKNF